MAFFDWLGQAGVTLHPGGWAATLSLLSLLQLRSGERVLDLGCGAGRTLAYVGQRFHIQAIGVDLVPALAVQSCRRVRQTGTGFALAADISYLPFRSQTFHAAWAESVFVFLPKPEAFLEVARVLRPGGRFGMVELTWRGDPFPESCEQTRRFLSVPRYEVLTVQEWCALLQTSGFSVQHAEKLSTHPLSVSPRYWLNDASELARLLIGLLRQIPIRLWAEGAEKVVNLLRYTTPAIFVATKEL